MARFDLTDAEWAVIEPLLPTDVRGKERADDRRVLNGIFWRLRTGAPWADIPARYGPRQPLSTLAQARHLGSASGRRVKGLRGRPADDRRHQRAGAPACRLRPKKDGRSGGMGRSRGGLTSKIHALVDAEGRPVALKITEGTAALPIFSNGGCARLQPWPAWSKAASTWAVR